MVTLCDTILNILSTVDRPKKVFFKVNEVHSNKGLLSGIADEGSVQRG